ncbi:MAG: rhodanese-like domain-containing protein [Maribacter sp.]|uniref:rhodanese-like domain-containing protein n=1 Tax=Maribacter sp. TaxID=1897614 RepID=UPI003C772B79
MKRISLYLVGLLLLPSLLFTSCDRGDDIVDSESTPAFTLLKDHMMANGLDVNNIDTNADGEKFVVGAPAEADLDAFLAKYTIIDIRNNTDFLANHIQGAKNVAFADILTEGAAATKPILVVCYTGQTACYATALMRLYGYSHTRALKWGMSGWNAATAGPWNNNIGNAADGNANWSYDAAPANNVFSDPVISSFSTDGAQILKDRVEQVVAGGFKTVTSADVLASPSGYFINNYFSEADYIGFGHIDGAHRILPLTLADNSYLGLDPDPNAKVVSYCYTGQTSAVLTACLRVLGYDAYSLLFGMNGMFNSNTAFTSNQWGGDSNSKNLPLVN